MSTQTQLLRDMVREYFSGEEWSLTFEVGNGTGAGVKRHADAVAMNLWPSRGLSLHGIEIKASRTDWQKELANPAKAEEIHQYCDFWWLVTAHGVVKDINEIPHGWGFMEMNKRESLVTEENKRPRLKMKRQASRSERPHLVDRGFVAAILRAHQRADGDDITRRINAVVEKRVEDAVEHAMKHRAREQSEAIDTLAKLTAACNAVGMQWLQDDEMCRAVAFVMKTGVTSSYSGIGGLIREFKTAGRNAQHAESELRKAADILGILLPEEKLI